MTEFGQGKIAVIGECMLEVSCLPGDGAGQALPAVLSYGGDTLNTAVYLARLGVDVDYVTALGDDDMSEWMLHEWRKEGVGCDLVFRFENSLPGLYLIKLDGKGERSFFYWRSHSPATRLFDKAADAKLLFERLSSYPLIYLSGITLALYSDKVRDRLFRFLARYRTQGGKVVFDGNYRPRLWPNPDVARDVYQQMYRVADMALPSDEDEALLFGPAVPRVMANRLWAAGVSEVVIKMGANGCLLASQGEIQHMPTEPVRVEDSTAAGDAFNAGFLAARMRGADWRSAAASAHNLAAVVVQHHGAIIPREAMPATNED
ncbi:MAG: sugar kinase [Pseudomonadota bacterium]